MKKVRVSDSPAKEGPPILPSAEGIPLDGKTGKWEQKKGSRRARTSSTGDATSSRSTC